MCISMKKLQFEWNFTKMLAKPFQTEGSYAFMLLYIKRMLKLVSLAQIEVK